MWDLLAVVLASSSPDERETWMGPAATLETALVSYACCELARVNSRSAVNTTSPRLKTREHRCKPLILVGAVCR